MTTITPEQRLAVSEAGEAPVELAVPQTGITYVLLRADVYHRLHQLQEEDKDRREQDAWGKLAKKARDSWANANPR